MILRIAFWLFGLISYAHICERVFSHETKNVESPSPLIIIPGDGGSRAYTDLHYIFMRNELVWVNFELMVLPSLLRKWFSLVYNASSGTTTNMPNSDVFFPGWGSTETLEELDQWKHSQTTYFAPLVDNLLTDNFYVRNKTLRGAPYDFRKGPKEMQQLKMDLKNLVEETYINGNGKKIVVLGHSLGCIYSLIFLNSVTISWKEKYIRSFMCVSGPLGGAVKALLLETSGDSLGSPRNPVYFRDMQRSFPSTAFLLPRTEIFGSEPLILTPKRNYSALEYKDIFLDMNFPDGYTFYQDSLNSVDTSKAPDGISEIYCIHGNGLDTARNLIFPSFPDDEYPTIKMSDGDSTVPIESLQICKHWQNTNYVTLDKADHMKIVGDERFIQKLKQILYQNHEKTFNVSKSFRFPKENLMVRLF